MGERTKRTVPLNRISGAVAGGMGTVEMPLNVRYHALLFQYITSTAGGATKANMIAEITAIRIILDEVVQRTFSAQQLFDINESKGIAVKDGFLPIFFSEPQRESKIEREATAWGMAGVGSFTIEVDIAANGQTCTLKGLARTDKVHEAPKGIVKWKRKTLTINTTGPNEHNFMSERGDSIQGIHLFEATAGDIDDVLAEWDGEKMHSVDETQADAALEYFNDGYVAVAKKTFIAFDGNHPEDALRARRKDSKGREYKVDEVLLTLDMGAAVNVNSITEVVGLPY